MAAVQAERATIWTTFHESSAAVKTILAGVLVNRLSGFVYIFLVLYLISGGYSPGQAVVALGVYGVGAIAGALIGGAVADRQGARRAIAISMGCTGLLTASLLFLPNYPLLLTAVFLVSLAAQMFRPASATLLSQLTRADRQVMIFAMFRFGLNVGAMAAPLVGYALYNLGHQRYTLLFWGEALIALTFGLVAWATLPRRRVQHRVGEPVTESRGGYLAVLRDQRFTLYIVAMFFHSAVYVQYLSTLPLNVSAAGVRIFWYTAAVALNGFIVIAFELLVTKLSQGWPRRLTIVLGWALVGIGVATYGLPFGPIVIIAGTLVWSLGEIIGGPTVFAYPAIAAPPSLKGRYIGSFQFMFGLGQAVGPIVGGWLFIHFGHLVWPLVAIGSLIACLLGIVAVRPPADDRSAVSVV